MNIFQRGAIKFLEIAGNLAELCLIQPFLFERKKNLTVIKNINYDTDTKSKRSVLDLYFLKSSHKKPVIFFFHGGGFIEGRKETKKYYCYHLARAGYFLVNIDYDYGVKYPFPSHIKQLLKAIDFILDKREEYNLDVENIILAGDSAGAYFASYIAMLEQMPSIYDALNINFKHKQQLNLKSLILISGLFDLKETLATKFPFYKLMYAVFTGDETKNVNAAMCSKERDIYSIYDKMKSSYPKTFIITGSNDPLKACSISLNKVLQAKNIEHEYYYCKSFFSSLHSGGIHVKRGDGKIALEKTLQFIKN